MNLILCRAETCTRHGAPALAAFAQALLGVGWHETTADGAVTLQPAECIGLCNGAPCGSIDGRSVVRLSTDKLRTILLDKPGPGPCSGQAGVGQPQTPPV